MITDTLPVGSATDGPRGSGRWVHVGMATLAMVATLPGRTYGLGLLTEPILQTFDLDRETYGVVNRSATMIGVLYCLPCGWAAARPLRPAGLLARMMAALAATVVGMSSRAGGVLGPAVLVLLTRGLGQSALSVAGLALVGGLPGYGSG